MNVCDRVVIDLQVKKYKVCIYQFDIVLNSVVPTNNQVVCSSVSLLHEQRPEPNSHTLSAES